MGSTLELSPLPRSISLFRIRQIADAGPDRDDLDFFNLANDFKFHSSSVPSDNLIQMLPDGHGFLSLLPFVDYSLRGALTPGITRTKNRQAFGIWCMPMFGPTSAITAAE